MKDSLDLRKFNAAQREAVCHNTGPALVLAGPGSGKTTVITKRLQYLTQILRIPPEQILVVTFTKAAAEEMQQRFRALAPDRPAVRFGTFHAVYYHILREHSHNPLTLIKEKEKQEYMRRILRRESIGEELADDFLEQIARIKNGGRAEEKPAETGYAGEKSRAQEPTPRQVETVFLQYRQLCREEGKLDFDDMAYECLDLLRRCADVRHLWQRRCRYILADEYQDIAPVQEKILFLLALPENNLFLVGDDDQSIYGFRGAGTESMLSFPARYPDTSQIFLDMNYRSRPGIIEAAGRVIAENRHRFVKKQTAARQKSGQKEVYCRGFPDRDTQNAEIVQLLKGLQREKGLSGTAVLFRKNADAAALTALLGIWRIPYAGAADNAGGTGSHFITDDVTAYLRLLYGDRTRKNFYKIMNRPCRGLEREGCGGEQISFRELAAYHAYDRDIVRNIHRLEKDCLRACRMDVYAAVMYIRKGMGYEAYLRKKYRGAALEECGRVLGRLQELAGRSGSLEEWERHLREGEGRCGIKKKEDCPPESVRILTYHGSKGLEFDRVILPDLNEGTVPHKKAAAERELEEERRMFYVAMTRAREELHLYYRTGTKEEPETVSRFLKTILE